MSMRTSDDLKRLQPHVFLGLNSIGRYTVIGKNHPFRPMRSSTHSTLTTLHSTTTAPLRGGGQARDAGGGADDVHGGRALRGRPRDGRVRATGAGSWQPRRAEEWSVEKLGSGPW